MIGETILHYEIIEKLGEGGMGEVYKAHDTKLDRFVALKFLPSRLTEKESEKVRFIQEAKAASALNHPNVCTIYDIQENDGRLFIVMEYVDGETLRGKHNLSVKQVIDIGAQASEGLAAAHEKGIVHRDIKPENIMMTKSGVVKVMDFGLAKLNKAEEASRLTKAGTTLGTVGYMSPEQVQGQDVDHRSDIFSLGVVLYELLSGESPFKGVHETAIMYEIVNVDPPPISSVKEGIDPGLDKVILDCLEKDKNERCQSAKELAKDLRKIRKSSGNRPSRAYNVSSTAIIPQKPRTSKSPSSEMLGRDFNLLRSSRFFPWTLAFVFLAISVFLWASVQNQSAPPMKFAIDLGKNDLLDIQGYPAIAISPDGSKIVYKENSRLYLRKIDEVSAAAIQGTDNASSPFFSPDGNWLGFFSGGRLEKISTRGGGAPSIALASDAVDNRGATWGSDGSIVYVPFATSALYSISQNGGAARAIASPDSSENERTYRWPQFLPGDKYVIFTVGTLASPDYYENATIEAINVETKKKTVLIRGASSAKYISPGFLVYYRSGILYAVHFNPKSLTVGGDPVPVVEGVSSDPATGAGDYDFSDNGTLVYAPGESELDSRQLALIDKAGIPTILDSTQHPYLEPSISPDGKEIALVNRSGSDYDVWVYDIRRNTLSRLTFGGTNRTPTWLPDGKDIAYVHGYFTVLVRASNGNDNAKQIYSSRQGRLYLDCWTKDGSYLLMDAISTDSSVTGAGTDILVLPLKGNGKPWKLPTTSSYQGGAKVSGDGKWIVYRSRETGAYQICVQTFPNSTGKWQISNDRFTVRDPRWSPDGKTIFYLSNARMMSVSVSTSPSFSAGMPTELFDGFPIYSVESDAIYDVTHDGKYFLSTIPAAADSRRGLLVDLNWFGDLKEIVSESK